MSGPRPVTYISRSRPTIEGAGVRLKRVFGFHEVPNVDPFLLLDHFGSDDPDDYMAGFPWHPHRGIETVTYVLEGAVEHGDSIGNEGVIGSGDVQWMTAGGGIIHQEMPQRYEGTMRGFQLWVNLPRAEKMMEPRYRDVLAATIPTVKLDDGITVKVIAGEVEGTRGPVEDLVVPVEYIDVTVPPGVLFERTIPLGHKVVAYVFEGGGQFGPEELRVGTEHLVVLGDGGAVEVTASGEGIRFLLASGPPLDEPVAWRGPIVMNTQKELDTAFAQLRAGTFIRKGDDMPIADKYYRR
ncbi:MAG: pirin family protein [Candidatus Undinarchaeales archaeon]|jgi:hypothetical protein|nr:pirin family protein [Candidatus Undinarchaeales archaeon]MDP7492245.1 pirin family protein [Candidatus Undinarchaeales archaeon]